MNCPTCGTENPSEALFCHHCAEPLTATGLARQRQQDAREKKSRELELTEAVAKRLFGWVKLLGSAAGLIVLLFGALLGKGYLDIHKSIESAQDQVREAVNSGKSQIGDAIAQAKRDISNMQQDLPTLRNNIGQLKIDVGRYKTVNEQIGKLQSGLLRLQNDVVDLGHKTLKAQRIETNGPGTAIISFPQPGCTPAEAAGSPVSYCAQGSPLALTTINQEGKMRPVASFSDIGFQDLSRGPKPPCDEGHRGTLYVEKGERDQADQPFVCLKGTNDRYRWLKIPTGE